MISEYQMHWQIKLHSETCLYVSVINANSELNLTNTYADSDSFDKKSLKILFFYIFSDFQKNIFETTVSH